MVTVRGSGCIYQRWGSGFLWMKYYKDPRAFCESTKQTDPKKAQRVLEKKMGQIREGNFIGPRAERVRVRELAQTLIRDYTINGKKSLKDVEARWRLHLEPVFGNRRAAQVTAVEIADYIDDRQEAGASNGTINREMAAIKRAYSLGTRSMPTLRRPYIPHLEEAAPRSGFVEDAQYAKLAGACAAEGVWLRALLKTGYTFGCRIEELLGLRVRQVQIVEGTLRLDRGKTKNRQGRLANLSPNLKVLSEP